MLSAEREKQGCTKESLLRNRAALLKGDTHFVVRIVFSRLPYSCPTKISPLREGFLRKIGTWSPIKIECNLNTSLRPFH